jgi:UDP-N-acetylmuramoylalanine--D-glutamate ligase
MKEKDFVSLETSSFQLENIKTFKPKISVILNFSQNHLDRYKNMQEYFQAKKRIFMNQDENDYLVLNAQDPALNGLAWETNAQAVYFYKTGDSNPNQAAVIKVASLLNIDKELCLEVFRNFKGVEHRLEYVVDFSGITFINDSKSTTVDSTIWALNNISRPILLIAGGKDKGSDYSMALGQLHGKVKEVILIGQAKEEIKKVFIGHLPIREASTLEEAVRISFAKAQSGDCVLFSPMCSSFDMFSDYEERGRVFKKAVLNLAKYGT